jgi:hypothetical protein
MGVCNRLVFGDGPAYPNGCAHWIWPNGYCAHLNLKSSHFPNNLMGGPVPSCQTYKLLSEDPCDIKLHTLSTPKRQV